MTGGGIYEITAKFVLSCRNISRHKIISEVRVNNAGGGGGGGLTPLSKGGGAGKKLELNP